MNLNPRKLVVVYEQLRRTTSKKAIMDVTYFVFTRFYSLYALWTELCGWLTLGVLFFLISNPFMLFLMKYNGFNFIFQVIALFFTYTYDIMM